MFIARKTVAMSTAFFMKESIGDLFYIHSGRMMLEWE